MRGNFLKYGNMHDYSSLEDSSSLPGKYPTLISTVHNLIKSSKAKTEENKLQSNPKYLHHPHQQHVQRVGNLADCTLYSVQGLMIRIM